MFQTNSIDKIKTHFMFNNFFFENPAVYDVLRRKHGTEKQATLGNVTWR